MLLVKTQIGVAHTLVSKGSVLVKHVPSFSRLRFLHLSQCLKEDTWQKILNDCSVFLSIAAQL